MQARKNDHSINPIFMCYPIIEFEEVNISEKKTSRFDITKPDIESHMAENKCSRVAAYNEILLGRLGKYSKLEKEEFIKYHLEGISDKKGWIFSFEKLIDSRVDGDNELAVLFWQKDLKGVQEILEDQIRKINSSIPDRNIKKIPTTLSVPELGYLLRALFDENIITSKNKTELFKVFADTFSSKKMKNISADSLGNNFNSPDPKAIDKMQEVFTHLMQRAKKDNKK